MCSSDLIAYSAPGYGLSGYSTGSITLSNKIVKPKKLDSEIKAEKYWQGELKKAQAVKDQELIDKAIIEIRNINNYLEGKTPLTIISTCKHQCKKFVKPIERNKIDDIDPYDQEELVKLIENHSDGEYEKNIIYSNNLTKIENILVSNITLNLEWRSGIQSSFFLIFKVS